MLPTDHNLAIDLLQDESSLIAQLGSLSPQHANQPLLPQAVVAQPELKELLQNLLGRVILLEKANMVEKDLEERKKKGIRMVTVMCRPTEVSPEQRGECT